MVRFKTVLKGHKEEPYEREYRSNAYWKLEFYINKTVPSSSNFSQHKVTDIRKVPLKTFSWTLSVVANPGCSRMRLVTPTSFARSARPETSTRLQKSRLSHSSPVFSNKQTTKLPSLSSSSYQPSSGTRSTSSTSAPTARSQPSTVNRLSPWFPRSVQRPCRSFTSV